MTMNYHHVLRYAVVSRNREPYACHYLLDKIILVNSSNLVAMKIGARFSNRVGYDPITISLVHTTSKTVYASASYENRGLMYNVQYQFLFCTLAACVQRSPHQLCDAGICLRRSMPMLA